MSHSSLIIVLNTAEVTDNYFHHVLILFQLTFYETDECIWLTITERLTFHVSVLQCFLFKLYRIKNILHQSRIEAAC